MRALTLQVLLLFFLMGMLLSCTSKPQDLLDEEVYVDILIELHLLRAVDNAYGNDNDNRKILDGIFAHYNTTKEQFNRSHQYYEKDIDAQQERLRVARDIIQQEYGELNTRYLELR